MSKELYKQIGDWHTQTIAHGLNMPLLVSETVAAAEKQELQILCLTDHYPLPPDFVDPTVEKDCSMPRELYFGEYLQKVDEVRQEFKDRVEVRYGAEFDWLPGYVEWTKQETQARPYDYCIGSVHFLKDPTGKYWILDYTEDVFRQAMETFRGIENLVKAYYREIRAMVKSGLFDGVGHIDLIKKYSSSNAPLFDENAEWYKEEVTQTLETVKDSSMSIELNTAGWYKKCKVQYPSAWILKIAKSLGIPLTIGSDGHIPPEIGRDVDRAIMLANNVGYDSIAVYQERMRTELLI